MCGIGGRRGACEFRNVRDEAAAATVAGDITARGGKALPVQADVTDAASVGQMTCLIEERLGPVGALVCNAVGAQDPAFGQLLDIPNEAVETLVLTQLRAVLTSARAVLPGMVARGRGSVVVVSSGLARHPQAGFSAISMAKGAVEAAARAMAEEFGPHGVRASTVAPGPTLTDAAAWASADVRRGWANLTPLRRNALAEDVAGPIAFLAGDGARFVTGAHLPADGGVVMP